MHSKASGLLRPFLERRDFLKFAGFAAGATVVGGSALPLTAMAQSAASGGDRSIEYAGYLVNRTEALFDGRVEVEGFAAKFVQDAIGNINSDVFSGPQSREVTEIGLHPFMLAYANEEFRDYSLLPIFPLRLFRHKSIFIRNDRGIEKPGDLRGKTIATPGYSSTSLTWIRGLLQDEYGVSPQDVEWVLASKDSSAGVAGKASKQENIIPDGIEISQGPEGRDESDLLEAGDVDALFHAAEPRAFIKGHPKVARLFADSRAVEQAYFARTGIFPIMHAVAIRNDMVERHPALPRAVFDAFVEAKQAAYMAMAKGWYYDSLPWYGQELAATRELMGQNFYTYGLDDGNRKTLEALFRYSHQQGLASRQLTLEEVFLPESLEYVES